MKNYRIDLIDEFENTISEFFDDYDDAMYFFSMKIEEAVFIDTTLINEKTNKVLEHLANYIYVIHKEAGNGVRINHILRLNPLV